MARFACPVCHDPNAFPIWIDTVPPATCPDDPAWPHRSLNSICPRQLRKAEQSAELRRLTPDAFDANGVMIKGESGRVWENWCKAHPKRSVIV